MLSDTVGYFVGKALTVFTAMVVLIHAVAFSHEIAEVVVLRPTGSYCVGTMTWHWISVISLRKNKAQLDHQQRG